jgi:hypothetical protein
MPPIPANATHTSPIPAHATHNSPCHPCQSRSISPSFLFHVTTLLQNLAAQFERSCTVNVISVSGSTAGRRNNLSNSRTKGAPLIVRGAPMTGKGVPMGVFEAMVISVVAIGTNGRGILWALGNALVDGRLPISGASSHFSIRSVDCASCIEIIMTILTLPLDSVSHHLATHLR